MNKPYSHPSTAMDRSCASNNEPPDHDGAEMEAAPQPNEEPTGTVNLPWYTRALKFLTMYSELRGAWLPEDFMRVRTRLQQEWMFDAGFVSQSIIMFFTPS